MQPADQAPISQAPAQPADEADKPGATTAELDHDRAKRERDERELREANKQLTAPDAALRPDIYGAAAKYLRLRKGPQGIREVVTKLSESYVGYPTMASLVCGWLGQLEGSHAGGGGGGGSNDGGVGGGGDSAQEVSQRGGRGGGSGGGGDDTMATELESKGVSVQQPQNVQNLAAVFRRSAVTGLTQHVPAHAPRAQQVCCSGSMGSDT